MGIGVLRCHPGFCFAAVLVLQPAVGIDDFNAVDHLLDVVLARCWGSKRRLQGLGSRGRKACRQQNRKEEEKCGNAILVVHHVIHLTPTASWGPPWLVPELSWFLTVRPPSVRCCAA